MEAGNAKVFRQEEGLQVFFYNFSLVTFRREEEGCLQNGRTTMQEGNSRTLRAERSNHQSNSLHLGNGEAERLTLANPDFSFLADLLI